QAAPYRGEVVQRHRDRQTHQPGQVGPVQCLGDRALVEGGVYERDLNGKADQVDRDCFPLKSAVLAAVLAEEGVHVVLAVPDQVEVDQVDRGPRDQQVEQEEDEVVVAGQEGGLVGECADQA